MTTFYLGSHHATQPWFDLGVPLFVSRRVLTKRKQLPTALAPWALDSGGFTELAMFGEWRTTEREYVRDVERFTTVGRLEWVAPQDWMCEPFMLKRTGLTVEDHQARTVESFVSLRDRLGELAVPVLQGWTLDEYLWCAEMYEAAGVDLAAEPRIGLGSVCRRQDTAAADRIVRRLASDGLRLHGFGVKTAGLDRYGHLLASADSLAWSYDGRVSARRGRGRDRLFDVPQVGRCGHLLATPAHPAKSCANCRPWASRWRADIVGRLDREGGRRVKLSVVPVTRDEVRLFVREHHRHNSPLRVEVIRAGLADETGELVGVATAGLPARLLMDGRTLEVTRVCTVGHRNACSMLYGAIRRAAKALGWKRLYTYTLESEDAASVRAAGFVYDGHVPAREYLSKTHRPRYGENLFGERAMPEEAKIRWRLDLA